MSRQYRPENPDLPTLDPWRNTTPLPAEQFVFERNPLFPPRRRERAATALYRPGSCSTSARRRSSRPRPAPARADLQFTRYRLRRLHLPEGSREALPDEGQAVEAHAGLRVSRCCRTSTARRSRLARPILRRRASAAPCRSRSTAARSTWSSSSALPRKAPTRRCRTARCSSRNTSRPGSAHDPDQANALLDEAGLTERDDDGFRLLPDGRRRRSSSKPPARARRRPTCSS